MLFLLLHVHRRHMTSSLQLKMVNYVLAKEEMDFLYVYQPLTTNLYSKYQNVDLSQKKIIPPSSLTWGLTIILW